MDLIDFFLWTLPYHEFIWFYDPLPRFEHFSFGTGTTTIPTFQATCWGRTGWSLRGRAGVPFFGEMVPKVSKKTTSGCDQKLTLLMYVCCFFLGGWEILLQWHSEIIHAAPRQGPPAPRSQGVTNASGFVWSVMCLRLQSHFKMFDVGGQPKTLYLAQFLCL